MSLNYNELNSAMLDIEETLRRIDMKADQMARMLKTRLRHVGHDNLKSLKRELREYDVSKGKWKC